MGLFNIVLSTVKAVYRPQGGALLRLGISLIYIFIVLYELGKTVDLLTRVQRLIVRRTCLCFCECRFDPGRGWSFLQDGEAASSAPYVGALAVVSLAFRQVDDI